MRDDHCVSSRRCLFDRLADQCLDVVAVQLLAGPKRNASAKRPCVAAPARHRIEHLYSEGLSALLVCNLGSGSGFSVREVLAAAERVTGRQIPAVVGARRAGDPPVLLATIDRAREALGWTPRRGTLDEMIESAWAWRSAHPEGYAS